MQLNSILENYGLGDKTHDIQSFGSGLINHTWKIIPKNADAKGNKYILQRVNHAVFRKPQNIADNIRLIADNLKIHHPDYLFTAPIVTLSGKDMIYCKGKGYFRLFAFVVGSHSKDVVSTPEQAFEAAKQFGRFTRLLSDVDIHKVKQTIPHFHDITLRFRQFLKALKNGQIERLQECDMLIKKILSYKDIVKTYRHLKTQPDFKLRVTHHDTKISNVLFDDNNKGLCVIDLDTVMPGYFISDVGDMMRTYLSPVSEEETDFSKISVRPSFYKAIEKGYLSEMRDELSQTEKGYFFYAGCFMIYMQALRFLTDYLNNDIYYGAKYPKHNYNRAANQVVLLEKLYEKQAELA